MKKGEQKQSRKEVFKMSLFGICRTALLMASLLLIIKDYKIYGGIGIVLYALVLFFEKRYKHNQQNK